MLRLRRPLLVPRLRPVPRIPRLPRLLGCPLETTMTIRLELRCDAESWLPALVYISVYPTLPGWVALSLRDRCVLCWAV